MSNIKNIRVDCASKANDQNQSRRRLFLGALLSLNVTNALALLSSRSAMSPMLEASPNDRHGGNNLALALPQNLINMSQLGGLENQFLMSEKLDGVRAYWDGKTLYFRSGNVIKVPSWFTKDFPKYALDGELWIGRGQFERLSGMVRRQIPNDDEWRQIQYCLFELPFADGDFSRRIETLKRTVEQTNIPWLTLIPQEPVRSPEQIKLKLNDLVAQKAEGLVLHRSDAPFQAGRSESIFKLKPQFDAEAKVVGILSGAGKYEGLMGALLVETPEGVQFRIGTGFNVEQRRNPPQIGSIIVYRYRDRTSNGLPRFASFLRIYHPE